MGLARRVSADVVVEISDRLRAGRGCGDLVEAGALSRYQLGRLRALILQKWASEHVQLNIHGLIALEHHRLEAIGELAIDAYHSLNSGGVGAAASPEVIEGDQKADNVRELKSNNNGASLLIIALKASDARRKLLGLDAPERKHVLVTAGPGALLDAAWIELDEPQQVDASSVSTTTDCAIVPVP